MIEEPVNFAARLLRWWDEHGRKDLPWQRPRTPYRVWISEIMLQQTQVQTVSGYFQRFVLRFADAAALASADLDEVLHLWSGLGYYARARNLHRAARIIVRDHGGELPPDPDALRALPGIGRSTAGAIAAIGYGLRAPILDGNVKRVLTRVHAIDGWPGGSAITRELWALADHYTPTQRVADFTQAIMDLGATVCTRRAPACPRCPLRADCRARATGRQHTLPTPRPRKALPHHRWQWLIERNHEGHVRLVRRPPDGIWGGLWAFPPAPARHRVEDRAIGDTHDPPGGRGAASPRPWGCIEHAFTHFRVSIELTVSEVDPDACAVNDAPSRWIDPADPPKLGLATPVRRVLESLVSSPPGPLQRSE